VCRRIFFVAVFVSIASVSTGLAQNTKSQSTQPSSDRLKKLLEDKFIPPPTERPTTFDKRDYYEIVPPKQTTPPPSGSGRGGRLELIRDFVQTQTSPAIDFEPRNFLIPANAREHSGARVVPVKKPVAAAQTSIAENQAGAIANVYLIQLKPNATEAQINALLHKYALTPIGGISNLHILRVRGKEVGSAQGQAQNPFTQRILTDLRREPIVAAAAVDTTLSVRSVPRAANTSSNISDVSHIWSWKNDRVSAAGLLSSTPAKAVDGNWGLKTIRMPAVWSIIQHYRESYPNRNVPRVAIIDTGFSDHEDLSFEGVHTPSTDAPSPSPAASAVFFPCNPSGHGNHVAGIIGATYGNGMGIDGIVPQAKMHAVFALSAETLIQDPSLSDTTAETRIALFGNVLSVLAKYLYSSSAIGERRIVNISLGYNIPYDGDPNKIAGLGDNIANQAIMFGGLMRDFENSVLFVTAAGNDSEGRTTPLDAKWSSPITWAATEVRTARGALKNVIVVEAHNRFGERASFSNLSRRGSVSAPGVDILSTLVAGKQDYHVCQGTSQAAPHVSGIAALLFELAPSKRPAEIADIIRTSAIKPSQAPGAQIAPLGPRLDALDAVLRLSPFADSRNENLVRLADLNRDGKVDIEDLRIFAKHIAAIEDNRANGTAFTGDLNGDGAVDGNECNWPQIDLNGSGTASLSLADAKMVLGMYRTDLDVLALAWTDKAKDFKSALKELGLDVALQTAETAPMAVTSRGCR
jgi:Subtilase family/Dockerin type I domain